MTTTQLTISGFLARIVFALAVAAFAITIVVRAIEANLGYYDDAVPSVIDPEDMR